MRVRVQGLNGGEGESKFVTPLLWKTTQLWILRPEPDWHLYWNSWNVNKGQNLARNTILVYWRREMFRFSHIHRWNFCGISVAPSLVILPFSVNNVKFIAKRQRRDTAFLSLPFFWIILWLKLNYFNMRFKRTLLWKHDKLQTDTTQLKLLANIRTDGDILRWINSSVCSSKFKSFEKQKFCIESPLCT